MTTKPDFALIEKAPPRTSGARIMTGRQLAREVALGVLDLAVRKQRPITVESLQEVRPALRAYQQKQSTIPTYMGAGRSGDGLGLWRGKDGCTPSYDNAGLAARKLLELVGDQEKVAVAAGWDSWEEMAEAIQALPTHEELCRPS